VKVLHIAESVKGGVQSYLEDLQVAMRGRDGLQISYILPHSVRGVEGDDLKIISSERTVFGQVQYFFNLLHFLRSVKPDVIHLHSSLAGLMVRLMVLLGLVKSKIVFCPHGWSYIRDDGVFRYMYMLVEYVLGFVTDAVVAISEHEREISVVSLSKVVLIKNGVRDLSDGSDSRFDGRRKLLYVGRFDRAKGVDALVKGFSERERGYELILVGDTVLNDVVLPRLANNIDRRGWVARDDIANLYAESWGVIIPSRWDGFNLVAVEAMSFGKPVFASNVGGLKGLVDNTVGSLFELENIGSVLDWFETADVDELAEKGAAGRVRFEHSYKIDRVARQLEALYMNLSQDRKRC
jgi:glycosyltransferase involved in cell wall biosynthesis